MPHRSPGHPLPPTGSQPIGAPLTSGSPRHQWGVWSGYAFAQRSAGFDNTLGLGVSGGLLLVQATPNTSMADPSCCRWWLATVTAHSLIGVGGTVTPTRAELQATGRRQSDLQVQLEFSDGSGQRQEVNLDVGPGFALGFWGSAPKIRLLLDSAMVTYRTPGLISDIPAATIDTSLVEGSLQCTDSQVGLATWQATVTRQAPIDTTIFLPIQPRAQYVEVTQSSLGPPTASLDMRSQGGVTVGTYDFTAGARSGPRVRVPGMTANLVVGAVADLRSFSAIWEVHL